MLCHMLQNTGVAEMLKKSLLRNYVYIAFYCIYHINCENCRSQTVYRMPE